MQFLMEYDFNLINVIFNILNSDLTNNYFLSGYDYDDCPCGASCNCGTGYNVIESGLIGLIFFAILILIAWILISYNKDSSKYKSKMSDIPLAWGLYFQDGASPSFEGIVDLHNRIMFYLVIILFGVSWIMFSIIWNFNKSRNKLVYRYLNHGKYVPIQKCSKFDNAILKSKNEIYTPLWFYTTLSSNHLYNNDISLVKVYENAYDMKKDILKENKGKSGIYLLTNRLTNDIYIGQFKDISKRFRNYFNLSYIKSKDSFIISRALIKYGYSNFSVTILEYCDKSDLTLREQYYFNKLNPQYNILKIAGSSLGFKHSE